MLATFRHSVVQSVRQAVALAPIGQRGLQALFVVGGLFQKMVALVLVILMSDVVALAQQSGGSATNVAVPLVDVREQMWVQDVINRSREDPMVFVRLDYVSKNFAARPDLVWGGPGSSTRDFDTMIEEQGANLRTKWDKLNKWVELAGKVPGPAGTVVSWSHDLFKILGAPILEKEIDKTDALLAAEQDYQLRKLAYSKDVRERVQQIWRQIQLNPELHKSIMYGDTKGLPLDEDLTVWRNLRPELQASPVVTKIIERIVPGNPVINIPLDELKNLAVQNQLELAAMFGETQALLRRLEAGQKEIADLIRETEAERRRKEQEARQNEMSHELRLDAANASVYLLSTFVGFADKKLGEQIGVVGRSAIQIVEAVDKFSTVIATLGAVDKLAGALSSVVLTGNIVSAAMNIVNMILGVPTTEQLILEQLQQIQRQIDNLGKDMHSRFDRVDKALNIIFDGVRQQIGILIELNGKVDQLVAQATIAQSVLMNLQRDVFRMERGLYRLLTDVGQQDLQLAMNGYLSYRQRNAGRAMSAAEFLNSENIFQFGAFQQSLHYAQTEPTITDRDVAARLSSRDLAENINVVLIDVPRRILGIDSLIPSTVANPAVWAMAANAWLALLHDNPQYAVDIPTARGNAILSVGTRVQAAYRAIAGGARCAECASNTATPVNFNLFKALASYYDRKSSTIITHLDSMESEHKQKAGYPLLNLNGNAQQSLQYQPSPAEVYSPSGTRMTGTSPVDITMWRVPGFLVLAEYLKLGKFRYDLTEWETGPVVLVQPGRGFSQPAIRSHSFKFRLQLSFYRSDGQRLPISYIRARSSITTLGASQPNLLLWPRPFQQEHEPALLDPDALGRYASDVDQAIAACRTKWYNAALSAIVSPTPSNPPEMVLSEALTELDGAYLLYRAYVSLGMTRSLISSDALRGLLFGRDSIVSASGLQIVYMNAASAALPPPLDIKGIMKTRVTALQSTLDGILKEIAERRFEEGSSLIDNTLLALNLYITGERSRPTVTDVTAHVALRRLAASRDAAGRIVERISIRNKSSVAIPGPLSLTFENVTGGSLWHYAGVAANNAPWVGVAIGADNQLSPDEEVIVTVPFAPDRVSTAPLAFRSRALAGIGPRFIVEGGVGVMPGNSSNPVMPVTLQPWP